ncbi:restriction endonuclease subunit S [Salmonella enterica]|nr:restriction endonuclease subunit S [Salmonella enterica]
MSGGKLPEGWAKAPVSTVTTLIRGVTYKKEQAINYLQDDYLPLIRANNIQNGKFDTTDLVFVPKNLVKESQRISPEDIVIAMSSGSKSVVGKSAHQRLPFECSFGAFCGVLRPEKRISPSFIAHFTKSSFYRNKISSLSAGANINNIKPASFDLINIPIPALAEQKIIAEKLDTLLAQVDSTKARLEQIPQVLKRFRQAVLGAAVSGKIINQDYTQKSLALGSFVSIDIGNAFKSSEFSEDGIPLLRGQNIEPGSLRWDETKKFPLEKLQRFSHLFIKENDIILAMDRPIISTGLKLAKAKRNDIPCVLVQRVARFKEFKNLLPDYLYLLLKDLAFINYIQPNQTGSDIPHISGKQILNFNCHMPPLPEQHEIVRRVEQLFAYADTIEKQVNNALTRVNSLTQSILAKAFRGELTAQWRAENPDLISGENSAAALLEKIKAERAASGGKKASRKKA